MSQENETYSAGAEVSGKGNEKKFIGKEDATLEVGSKGADKNYGILVKKGGALDATQTGNFTMKVGSEHASEQTSNATDSCQQANKKEAVGMAAYGGDLTVTMDGNATTIVDSNKKGSTTGYLFGEDSSGTLTLGGNASIKVGAEGQTSEQQNRTSGDQGNRLGGESGAEGKINVKVTIFVGKGSFSHKKVNLTDKVQILTDEYKGAEYVVYCGDKKLDCNKTFEENGVKDGDKLKVGEEAIVTSNSARQRIA